MGAHDEGQMKLDEALERVERGADHQWLGMAKTAVAYVAEYNREFTTDDVWDMLTAWQIPPTREARALGAVMRWAAKEGLCTSTDDYRRSRRPECHLRPVMVWRSLR